MKHDNFVYIGWQKDEAANADKVWGVILLTGSTEVLVNTYYGVIMPNYPPHNCVIFWGRRGKKLQTQIKKYDGDVFRKITDKMKEYTRIDVSRLNEVYPEFEKDLEKTEFWATLKI